MRVQFDHRIAADSLAMKGETAPRHGLTALYKASYKAASLLKYSPRKHKVLVLVSGGADDASILYTLRDVLEIAREAGITVYSIALGSGADTYALRTIAHSTGGRFYAVDESASGMIAREFIAVLQEIANSYKAFYELTPLADRISTSLDSICLESDIAFSLKRQEGSTLRDAAPYLVPQDMYFPRHQIIATFQSLSATIDEEYEGLVSTLGETLKDNPGKVIELIGHTDQTGNDENNRNFALKRAQAVKRYLMLMGVNPAQIRIRSIGRERPIFYFENEDWKARANRRVELRWLDPSLVPYEILAQVVSAEEEAMRLEAEWNTRGYEAYYEPFLINRIPVFRIKLWGFPTLESAEMLRKELQQKYKLRLSVQ
jgi:outer membrane protein OmpA-like peptidoglycan-associated protein